MKKIGWGTHPVVMRDAAMIRSVFSSELDIKDFAKKFREKMITMYSSILTMHKTAVDFCVVEPAILDATYDDTVVWLTADYIGEELYKDIPMKYRIEWGLEEKK